MAVFATQLRTVLLKRSPMSSDCTSAPLFFRIIQADAPLAQKERIAVIGVFS